MPVFRVLLLCLLTVMIPVRSAWALTMSMVCADAGRPVTTVLSMTHERITPPCPHADAELAQSADETAQQTQTQEEDHRLCDICHVSAMQVPMTATAAAPVMNTGPPHGSEHFASVVLPTDCKPPRSL